MLRTSTPKVTFSGMRAHMLLLHFQECTIPRSPSSASAALPQLGYLILRPFTLPWSHFCVKTRHKPRFPTRTCSGCLMAKKNVLVLHANCHLWSPKGAARRQLHRADCFALLFFFPPFFLQTHNLLCLREPIECVSVCNKLLLGAAGLVHAKWKGSPPPFWEEQAKEGYLPGTGSSAGLWHVVVAPVRPTSSSPRCLNILCCCWLPRMSPWISITVRLNHCLGGICWAYDTHSGHLSQARESVQDRNLTGAASHGKSALGL